MNDQINNFIKENPQLTYTEGADEIYHQFGFKISPEAYRKRYRRLQMPAKKPQHSKEWKKDERGKLQTAITQLGLTEDEAVLALRNLKRSEPPKKTQRLKLTTKHFTIGYFSDAHIGHNKFNNELARYMVEFFKARKPDLIVNPGDHLEGMSGRPGHVYELDAVGFQQQFEKCLALYRQLDHIPHYGIDGNHDQWFYKKNDNGIIVGQELEDNLDNYHNLGQDEGNLEIGGIKIKLIHAGDGTAYADSYKLQKRIESFSGGEKPHLLFSGHYHKAIHIYRRGIHGFECGTLCGQSNFMKGKGTPAHMGFGLVTVYVNANGVERLVHEFVPGYER